jgi:catechol 2,3-dioxygenase-like lactoylglutathione lyase family enzyme
MHLPTFVPEIPVASLAPALAFYRDRLGFTIDWSDEALGLAGLSRGDARIFMADALYRGAPASPITLWLNLASCEEVDALHAEWSGAGVSIDAPEAKPHQLYECFAADPDGNRFRIFYDFGWEKR